MVWHHPWRLKAALAMLGAHAALTRHGRYQAWQRWIDAKASPSFSLWAGAAVRHDRIAPVAGERIFQHELSLGCQKR